MMGTILKTDKPWGHELLWAQTADHERKEETILVYSGRMLFQIEDEGGVLRDVELSAGMSHHVPVGRRHRMIGLEDCDVFEVSTNHLDDVVRLEDAYGRVEHARV